MSVSHSLRQSARKHAQALCLSYRSVWHILHSDLSLQPYKLQVVDALSNWDREMRLKFCCQFVGMLAENPDLLNKLLMSDEAHFHLHDAVNKQNFRYWSAANSHKLHQHFTMTQKLLYGALFGPEESDPTSSRMKTEKKAITVTSQCYTEMINEFLSPDLPPNNGTLWFQQDGAMAHTAVISIAVLHCLFPQWVISHFGDVPWPPHSLDLTAANFFLWGFLKSKVYSNHPTDLHALRKRTGRNRQTFRRKTSSCYAQLLNSCAPVH